MRLCTFLNSQAEACATLSGGKEASLPYIFDVKQREVLDSKAKRAILNCSRQWGKSTVAAAKAVQRASTLIDEASRVPDAMYKALRPMLAVSNGDLWLMSTPYGQRGFFYDTWAHGGQGWERISVPSTECARISKEFLDKERRIHGSAGFAQEYMCEFVDNGVGWFEWSVIDGALADESEPIVL
jgi:hypothetical protein